MKHKFSNYQVCLLLFCIINVILCLAKDGYNIGKYHKSKPVPNNLKNMFY